ncbi:hypothetical protein C4578_02395 [Candidatus Microgenomates bacterium]|jgi:hypothetical protein|nr:MAG: hypothetical protein C4578_02395 [Candidatus Microgenomates bacterium]
MVEKLNPEDIDKMSSGAQEAKPSVDLGVGIDALNKDLSPGKLAGPVIDRVLRVASVGATLAGLAGCVPEGSSASVPERINRTPVTTATRPPEMKTPTGVTFETATPEKSTTPTKIPTFRPAETPTVSPEKLAKDALAKLEGKTWDLQGIREDAGGQEIDPYEKEMQAFKEEIALMAEQSGINLEEVDMFLVGNDADIRERQDGTIEQIAPTKFFGIMISEKEEAVKVSCFTKDINGMEMNSSCDWFTKGEIWGSEFGEYVVKSPEGTALESFIIKEGEEELRVFKATPDQFGVLSVVEKQIKGELKKDENEEWVLNGAIEDKEGAQAVMGVIVTGENNGNKGTFLLECKTLPLERKLKEGILPETPDLALGRVYLSEKGIRYGYLDLKDGSWQGYRPYEEVESILEPIAAVIENAPQIRGLRVERQGENLHYIAEAGNPYGLKEGEKAGIIKENVYVGEEKTGGIVLDSRVARAITMEENKNRSSLFTFLPVDISGTGRDIRVNSIIAPEGRNYKIVRIDHYDELPVISPFIKDTEVSSASTVSYGQFYFDRWRLFPGNTSMIIKGEETRYLGIGGNYLEKINGSKQVSFGDVLTVSRDRLYFKCSSADDFKDLPLDSVSINGIPVFLQGN